MGRLVHFDPFQIGTHSTQFFNCLSSAASARNSAGGTSVALEWRGAVLPRRLRRQCYYYPVWSFYAAPFAPSSSKSLSAQR